MEVSSAVSTTGLAPEPSLMQPSITTDEQDTDQCANSLSVLSPFAEPFMPRDHIPFFQPLTVDVKDPDQPPTPTQSPPHQAFNTKTYGDSLFQIRNNRASSGNADLRNDRYSSYLLMTTGGSSKSLDACPRRADDMLQAVGSHAQQLCSETQELHKDPFSRSAYFLMLASGLQPPPSRADNLPVGFEREQKLRSASQSSVTSSESECSSSEVGENEYDLFGGLHSFDGLLSRYSDENRSSLAVSPADSFTDDSFFNFSMASRSESRLLPMFTQPSDCTNNIKATDDLSEASEGSVDNYGLLNRISCDDNLVKDELSQHDEGFSQIMSSSDLLTKPASETVTCNHSEFFSQENVQDDARKDEGDISERSEVDNDLAFDGDTTLLADCLTDENGNVLIDNVFRRSEQDDGNGNSEITFDANGNIVHGNKESVFRQVEVRGNLNDQPEYRGRGSKDSGFESLSELISMPEPRADSEGKTKESPDRQRPCSHHTNQGLSLYCWNCCKMLCPVCFANDHMDCKRVLTTRRACQDLRWQLLKLQSRVGSHINGLENKVKELKPQVDVAAERREEAKKQVNEQLDIIVKEIRAKHEQVLEEVEKEFGAVETQTKDSIQRMEKSILLMNYVNEFLEVLRQRDSGLELLSTYDQHLSQILQCVLKTAESHLEFVEPCEESKKELDFTDCHSTALSIVSSVLDKDFPEKSTQDETEQKCAAVPTENGESNKVGAVTNNSYAQDWGFLDSKAVELSARNEEKTGWETYTEAKSAANSDTGVFNSVSSLKVQDEDELMREILAYMKRFPPPVSNLPVHSTPSLYNEMIKSPIDHSPSDLIDDVFQYEDSERNKTLPSDIFTSKLLESSDYKIHQRLCPNFFQDQENSFVTDIHLTESGYLVFLDAANHCLKCVDLRRPNTIPVRLHVPQPLSICSAGWERVMVSCAGRTLHVYSVGGLHVRPVTTRSTRQQYRGLIRASDALVAAASPETRSVDLLDLGGRVLRSIMPVDFVRGPEVVGVTKTGELLVVHQPETPPTTLICFDMGGQVIWEHEMHTRTRHVSCCKVIGGADGYVYYALQGDSIVYRICPESGKECVLLDSRRGVKFPSSLAVDQNGRVLVGRNELPNVHFASYTSSASHPMLPMTTEIDFFIRDAHGN